MRRVPASFLAVLLPFLAVGGACDAESSVCDEAAAVELECEDREREPTECADTSLQACNSRCVLNYHNQGGCPAVYELEANEPYRDCVQLCLD